MANIELPQLTNQLQAARFLYQALIDIGTLKSGSAVAFTNAAAARAMTAAQFASLANGSSLVWVDSVKDFYRWNSLSTLTDDGVTTINPTLNGVAAGRLIRMLLPAPEWMLQLNWTVDSSAGNDENVGSAGSPIKTDAERQRRMGPNPTWNAGAYHIRYINDVPASDPVNLVGRRTSNATIFVHGAAVDGQGQSILYTVAADAVVVTLNRATNTPWQIASAGLPTSWTASGLVGKRLRRTNGTAVKGWVMKDLGTKNARVSQGMNSNTYTAPFSRSGTTWVPANGDTFVVETLTAIAVFSMAIIAADAFTVNSTGNAIVIESLDIGSGAAAMSNVDTCFTIFDGCEIAPASSSGFGFYIFNNCRLKTFVQFSGDLISIIAGYSSVSLTLGGGLSSGKVTCYTLTKDFTMQTCGLTVLGGGIAIGDFAVFDAPASALTFAAPGSVGFSGAASYWGSGNVGASIDITNPGVIVRFQTTTVFTVSSAAVDVRICGVTSVRPFDNATGAYVAAVNTTFTLLTTATPSGFGSHLLSPVYGAGLVQNT